MADLFTDADIARIWPKGTPSKRRLKAMRGLISLTASAVNLAERHLAEFQSLQDVLVRLHVLRCTVVDRDLTELEVDEWTRLTRVVRRV